MSSAPRGGASKSRESRGRRDPGSASGEKNARKNSNSRKAPARKPLERDEEVEILEEIARTGSAIARIQALKMLHKLRAEAPGAEPEGETDDGFGDLDELAPRRRSG